MSTHLKMGSPFVKLSLLSADLGEEIASTRLEDTAFRKARNQQTAQNHIVEQEGRRFNPRVVAAFTKRIDEA